MQQRPEARKEPCGHLSPQPQNRQIMQMMKLLRSRWLAVDARFRPSGDMQGPARSSLSRARRKPLEPISMKKNGRFPKVRRLWCLGPGAKTLVSLLTLATAHAAEPPQSDAQRQRFAMMDAAERGDVSAINRLLNVGTKVDVRDESLRTPLYLAVSNNRIEAVKLLLSEGASVNAQARDLDTPWLLAGALGRAEILRLMIPRGPDLNVHNRFGGTALIPACEKGHVEAVRVLLDTAIDVNHINELGWTCLLEIAYLSDGGPRHVEIARLVLQAGADPDVPDKRGNTALDHAETRKLSSLAALLKSHKANRGR
jgi:uncharacterized protein